MKIRRILEIINGYRNQYLSGDQLDAFDAYTHITTRLIEEHDRDLSEKPASEESKQQPQTQENAMKSLLHSMQQCKYTFAWPLTL